MKADAGLNLILWSICMVLGVIAVGALNEIQEKNTQLAAARDSLYRMENCMPPSTDGER